MKTRKLSGSYKFGTDGQESQEDFSESQQVPYGDMFQSTLGQYIENVRGLASQAASEADREHGGRLVLSVEVKLEYVPGKQGARRVARKNSRSR